MGNKRCLDAIRDITIGETVEPLGQLVNGKLGVGSVLRLLGLAFQSFLFGKAAIGISFFF